jgi:hypothetical protein
MTEIETTVVRLGALALFWLILRDARTPSRPSEREDAERVERARRTGLWPTR